MPGQPVAAPLGTVKVVFKREPCQAAQGMAGGSLTENDMQTQTRGLVPQIGLPKRPAKSPGRLPW